MNQPKAQLKSLSDLKGLDFYVPSYQRGYRWTESQIDELLRDLYDFSQRNTHTDSNAYGLQPIIVQKRHDKWTLVDGQQRLTTLWILMNLGYVVDSLSSGPETAESNLAADLYSLEYEDKPAFSALISRISQDVTKLESIPEFAKMVEEYADKNVDCSYFCRAVDKIQSTKFANKGIFLILQAIRAEWQNIEVIWYELDPEEDAITTFANVNANKIDLTNAELIKAFLVDNRILGSKEALIAAQWEAIEARLNDDRLWWFLEGGSAAGEPTARIGYLFEIWAVLNGQEIDPEDRYGLFRAVVEYHRKTGDAPGLWSDIQKIFETLCDWYEDYESYHLIGFILHLFHRDSAEKIKELYQQYSRLDKDRFKASLKGQILAECFPKCSSADDLRYKIDSASYETSKSGDLEKLLVLADIAALLRAGNEYERFPFDQFRAVKWSIEHVNPQNPRPDEDVAVKRGWAEAYRDLAAAWLAEHTTDKDESDEDIARVRKLIDSIDSYLSRPSGTDNLEKLIDEVKGFFGSLEIHRLGNLVLLDEATNKTIGNKSFIEKRMKVLQMAQENAARDDRNTFIPLLTRRVFGKEETPHTSGADAHRARGTANLTVWSPADMISHQEELTETILSLLQDGIPSAQEV